MKPLLMSKVSLKLLNIKFISIILKQEVISLPSKRMRSESRLTLNKLILKIYER